MKILVAIGVFCVVLLVVNHVVNNLQNFDFDEIFDDMKDI